jgi:hypothetical protein
MTTTIHQFKVSLEGVEPPIWRRIQVRSSDSFWHLHVAIQDAMGWLDYHLHDFRFENSKTPEIGIPDDETDRKVAAGWKVLVSKYFKLPGDTATYRYDFGDSWKHTVLLEGVLLSEPGVSLPQCIGGARSCPPEDCGGVGGYARLLQILQAPGSELYDEKIAWLQGHAKNYFPFRSEHFDFSEVEFTDPAARLKQAFPG